jgi:hypothetical protein
MIQLMSQEELARYPVAVFPPPAILPPEPERERGCSGCEGFRPEPQRSGNLQVDPEIRLPSVGMPVEIGYYYNAAATNNGPFGYGRQLSTNLTAQAKGAHPIVTMTRGNGAIVSRREAV